MKTAAECTEYAKLHRVFKWIVAFAAVLFFLALFFIVPSAKPASAKFISEFKQTVDISVNPTKPVFASGTNWYRASLDKTSVTAISFGENDYVPQKYSESFCADVNGKGTIRCYVVNGTELIISGNGWNLDGTWNDSVDTVYANAACAGMFAGFSSLTTISGIGNLDVSDCTTFSNMFHGCSSLLTLDLSSWNTEKLVTAEKMFYDCNNLVSVDLNGWNTASVSNMNHLFRNCYSLERLDLSDFDTGNVQYIERMFDECHSLRQITFSENFSTDKVSSMNLLFNGCSSLESLDLSSFDTSNVTVMTSMFYGCNKIVSLDLSGFNTGKVTSMQNMFREMSALKSIDLSSFNTSSVTTMKGMFRSDSELTAITVSDKFVVSAVSSADAGSTLFDGCLKLTGAHGCSYAEIRILDKNAAAGITYARIDSTNAPGYFTGETVTISYHSNGGDGVDYEQYVLPNKADYLTDCRFKKTGYHIVSWNTQADELGASYAPGESGLVLSENTDLYAVWAPNPYILSFDPGEDASVDIASKEVTYDECYGELPVAERTGYRFAGWDLPVMPHEYREVEYIQNSGTSADWIDTGVSGNNNNLIIETEINYPKYVKYGPFFGNYVDENTNVYRLILHENDNNCGYASSNTRAHGSLAVNGLTKGEWHAVRLYRNSSQNFAVVDGGNAQAVNCTNGSKNDKNISLFTSTPGKGSSFQFKLASFKMWNEEDLIRDFKPCYDTVNNEYGLWDAKNGDFYKDSGSGSFSGYGEVYHPITSLSAVGVKSNCTVYAIWEEDPVIISFDANGGEGKAVTQEILRDLDAKLNANTYTRDGYSFAGWTTSKALTADAIVFDDESSVSFSSDTTLYAQWTANSYTLSFDAGEEAQTDTVSMQVTYDQQYGELPEATREGYIFRGWHLDRLPDGYEELTYIENHGPNNEWIDTGVSGNNDQLKTELRFSYSDWKSYGYFFGNYKNEDHDAFRLLFQSKDNESGYSTVNSRAGSSSAVSGLTKNDWHVVIMYKDTVNNKICTVVDELDPVEKDCISGTENNENIALFAGSVNNTSSSVKMRLAGFRMWNGEKLIRDFVPCYYAEQGVYGLYDLVSDKFYGNQNSKQASLQFDGGEKSINLVKCDDIVSITGDVTLHAVWEKISE